MFKLLFYLFFATFLFSSNLAQKFSEAKKEYVRAILQGDKNKEYKSLKKIIYYGSLLNKDVKKYKKALDKTKNYSIIKSPKTIYKSSKNKINKVYAKNNSIIIKFNKEISKNIISYKTFKKNNLYYYEFYIKSNFNKAYETKLKIKLAKIVIYQKKQNLLKISIYNSKKLTIDQTIYNNTIVLKIKKYKYIKKTKLINTATSDKKKIIVIDPGHGGKDSGAVGWGYKEKNIVLAIGKYLYEELRDRGYKVYITRNKNRFISLKYRTHYANKKNADLFISIHANAVAKKSKKNKVKGIETYFLSPARSARAKRVAALENRKEIAGMNYNTKNIFLNVLNRKKIIDSQKLAIDIQRSMIYSLKKAYGNDIVDGGVRKAPFWVLVGALMPAVLIEVGYISNKYEARRLNSKYFQKKIARAIADGIDDYLAKNM